MRKKMTHLALARNATGRSAARLRRKNLGIL